MSSAYASLVQDYAREVRSRLAAITELAGSGGLDAAVDLLARAVEQGAVIHAFGTGHSEAFAMEIAGRAGGLIPTNKIALRDVVVRGSRTPEVSGSALERDPSVVDELWDLSPVHPGDVLVIASNSGVNGSIVGLALLAKEQGHPVLAVTSLEHTRRVEPKHPSGKRLADIADVVLDNLAPYGDATIALRQAQGDGGSAGNGGPEIPVGAVSSITAAYLAQLLTLGVAGRLAAAGGVPPLYLSANIPGGDEHNAGLEARYAGRIRRGP